MFSSETSSPFALPNQNTLNNNNSISSAADGDFPKGALDINGPDFFQNHHQGSGLSRYRSAPSSFLAALLDPNYNTDNNSSSGDDDESDAFLSALIDKNSSDDQHRVECPAKQEIGAETGPRPGFLAGGYVGSYSVGMESQVQVMMRDDSGNKNGNCSNLVRQSSSPPGFFNGFGVMGEAGDYRVHNHAEAGSSAVRFINHQISFSSSPPSSSRFMPTIPENGNDDIPRNTTENGRSRNCDNNNIKSSWNESPFNALKRNRDGDLKMFSNFNELENQSGESRKMSTGLVSHLSLPKTSSEMAVVENYLHFQQETTIPCQVRAKRGCATHPRSIAERMRRTRISGNMKKLQDLFPNMDKQTNTADMLDLAVEYIKDLQKQVQTLNDMKAKCVCSKKTRQTSPTT